MEKPPIIKDIYELINRTNIVTPLLKFQPSYAIHLYYSVSDLCPISKGTRA